MSRQFVHGVILSKRLAMLSFIIAATVAMAISIAPGIAFADESEDAAESSTFDATTAAIQMDAASLAQDGEGVASEASLEAFPEEGAGEEVGIDEGAGIPGEQSSVEGSVEESGTSRATGGTGELGDAEGGAVAGKADLAGEGAAESGEAGEADEREGEKLGDARKLGEGAAPMRAGESDGAATFTITVSADPYVGGTASGGGDYAEGESVTVTATASQCYIFVEWSEDGERVSTDASYTFNATGNRTLIAMFDACEYEGSEGGGYSSGDASDIEEGTLIKGGVLDGATIRLRPQGSYKQVTVGSNGTFIDDVVCLSEIGATSRFMLTKASDDSYYISYFSSYDATEPHTREFYYLRPKNGDTLAKIHVNSALNSGATRWEFYRLVDGTYWIRNVSSGLHLSLYSLDNINTNDNALVQRGTRIKWEIELVRGPESSGSPRNELKEYDSYSFENGDGNDSMPVTSADWMSHLPDYAFLTDLSIPGVHDAGTVHVGGIVGDITLEFNPWRCQQLYIDDLLTNGVRFFDLRLWESENDHKIIVRHGNLTESLSACVDRDGNNLTIETVMAWTNAFLEAHPGETVILSFKNEGGNSDTSKTILAWFNNYRNTHDNIYVGFGNPQLKDVRGKIVLVSRIESNFHTDPSDPSSPSWAISVGWKSGQNYAPALAASTDAYEFWTQDKYHILPEEKWKWIEGSILSDEATGAKGCHDQALSDGKGAWVVSLTSTEYMSKDLSDIIKYGEPIPLDCARQINNRLKWVAKLSTDANEYVGIVCVDYMDEQLAQRIYAINFRVDLDNRRDQHPTFESSHVQKTYGDDPFSNTATNTEGGGEIRYRSENPDVAAVNAITGMVTIHGAGTVSIYADAAATDYYKSATAAYVLEVHKAAITVTASSGDVPYGDTVACTYAITSGDLKYDDEIDSLGIVVTTDAAAGSDAADYDVVLSGGTGNPSYNVTLVNGKLTISPRPVTVAVAGKTATYSGSEQYGEVAYSFANLLEGHTAAITYTPSSGTDVSATAYYNGAFGNDFRVVDGNGGDKTANYHIVAATVGALTIEKTPEAFAISLPDDEYDYDASEHHNVKTPVSMALTGATTYGYSFTENGDYTDDLASLVKIDAGTYTIYVRGANPNYERVATTTAMLTIVPAKVIITVADSSKVQYEDDPAFAGTVEGLVATGDLGEIGYFRTNDDEAPGSYRGVLTATYTPNPNYDVEVVNGDFTIRALLTVRWLDALGNVLQSTAYAEGDPVPAYDGKEPTKASTPQYDYAFAGWDGGTTSGAITTFEPLFDATVRSYGIALDLAGGVLDGMTGTIVESLEYGATLVLPLPMRDGYRFLYWEGSRYDAGDEYLVEGEHTFTARWERIPDITPSSHDDGAPVGYADGGVPGGAVSATAPETGDELAPSIWVLAIAVIGSLLVIAACVRGRESCRGRRSQ